MVESSYEQPQLPLENSQPEQDASEQADDSSEQKNKNIETEIGRIVIDDTERGGLSERDRLAIPIDEHGQPEGIRNMNAYAVGLVNKFEKNPRALTAKYKELASSEKVRDRLLAQAMLDNSERLKGLLREESQR